MNVGKAKEHDYAYIEEEMTQLVACARKAGICCKVIFETCYLDEEEIIEVAKIASRVRPDFVKTSTGFGVGVKAAGGIRSWASAKEMIMAGATRLGTSSGIKIMEEMRAEKQ